jgi:hypothetical protein
MSLYLLGTRHCRARHVKLRSKLGTRRPTGGISATRIFKGVRRKFDTVKLVDALILSMHLHGLAHAGGTNPFWGECLYLLEWGMSFKTVGRLKDTDLFSELVGIGLRNVGLDGILTNYSTHIDKLNVLATETLSPWRRSYSCVKFHETCWPLDIPSASEQALFSSFRSACQIPKKMVRNLFPPIPASNVW